MCRQSCFLEKSKKCNGPATMSFNVGNRVHCLASLLRQRALYFFEALVKHGTMCVYYVITFSWRRMLCNKGLQIAKGMVKVAFDLCMAQCMKTIPN